LSCSGFDNKQELRNHEGYEFYGADVFHMTESISIQKST